MTMQQYGLRVRQLAFFLIQTEAWCAQPANQKLYRGTGEPRRKRNKYVHEGVIGPVQHAAALLHVWWWAA